MLGGQRVFGTRRGLIEIRNQIFLHTLRTGPMVCFHEADVCRMNPLQGNFRDWTLNWLPVQPRTSTCP